MDHIATLDVLLRGIAVGSQLGFGLALARSAQERSLRVATLLFICANIAFTLNGAAPLHALLGPAQFLLWLIQLGGAAYLWLFVAALFEDRRLTPISLAPAAGLTVLGLVGWVASDRAGTFIWTAHNILGLALALHAIFVIVRSGRVDLVEERRRLRVPFLVIIAGYSALLSAAQIGLLAGLAGGWLRTVDAGVQALLGIAGICFLLEARAVLFGRATAGVAAPTLASDEDADRRWLDRLQSVMSDDEPWRREGLAIADLAAMVGLPEHRLRRLINNRLDHRNFPSFVNEHRIAAAKELLADPAQGQRTVASIAFDLGFGSIGPFNRAFRDATGLTPTEYRRTAAADEWPILGKPR